MVNQKQLNEIKQKLFQKITTNEVDEEFKQLLNQLDNVNFVDNYGMSPLQQACFVGSTKSANILIEKGAEVNYSNHGSNYTPLHFAALSGNLEIILRLLELGATPNSLNSISRTPAQMAAFVGNHNCSTVINNYVSKSDLEHFTAMQDNETEPYLPSNLLDNFHRLVTQTNIHPVRIVLNLQKFEFSIDDLKKVKKVLEFMTEREMSKENDTNEIMAFKYHYFGWIVGELVKCQENSQGESVEIFSKRILKRNKAGQLDYLEYIIRECVREFPYRECSIFRRIVNQLANKDCPPALDVLKCSLHGSSGVTNVPSCSSCGEEKPDKKCSKCKEVQYCDRECQRLDWFMHKKTCARPMPTSGNPTNGNGQKINVDASEISEQFHSLVAR